MKLSSHELKNIKDVLKKWAISKYQLQGKTTLNDLYKALSEMDFTPIINSFAKRLNEVSYRFTKSEQVSGSICFFGGVLTSLVNTGKIEEIEGIFTFSLCYMLVDHFLDNIDNSEKEKGQCMKDIVNLLLYDIESSDNKLINAAMDRYRILIKNNPDCKKYIIDLLKSELQGVTVSKNKNLKREEYKSIAEEKGGKTSLAISQIIRLKDDSIHYDCGKCIQLIDDFLDIKDDESLNIYTLARYDLDHNNLDRYVYDSIQEIDKLSSTYNTFKSILIGGLVLAINDNYKHVSTELLSCFEEYNIFGPENSKDSLNEWFHEKLYEYIENRK